MQQNSRVSTRSSLIRREPVPQRRAHGWPLCRAGERPEKIIAVSCNPGTFVNDANTLVSAGYKLVEVTMVDQFVYSDHSELVALFTK